MDRVTAAYERLVSTQPNMNSGKRAGVPTDMAEKLKALERENRELRQANEILRKASAYFARASNRASFAYFAIRAGAPRRGLGGDVIYSLSSTYRSAGPRARRSSDAARCRPHRWYRRPSCVT
jgi:hypothetical protein